MRRRKPSIKWTNDEIATLIVSRAKGHKWRLVANEVNARHGTNRNEQSCSAKYGELMKIDVAREYTEDQTNFVQSMFLNNFTTAQIITGFKEQYQRIIREEDVDFLVKQIHYEEKVEEQIKTEKNKIKKEMKRMKKAANAWTKEDDEELLACGSWSKAMELDNGRSKAAKNQRWSLLKKQGKTPKKPVSSKPAKRGRMTKAELEMIRNCKTVEEALALNLRKPETIIRQFTTFNSKKKEVVLAVEPKQKKQKKVRKQYTPRWTKEEDYDLILNFYELSIDEARNRFNRSYGVIATRLEKLVDSTKPEHISMLMDASKEIKTRKQSQNPTPRKSRRTLRKERKNAKKEAKLKAKLQKLRGEKDGKQ